jgi:ubiquinone/menaquinone biosynthesis C-methylase UbiE
MSDLTDLSAREVKIDTNAVYNLGSSVDESERLQRQADQLALDSVALLDKVGLRGGESAIDLGCGPRGVIEMLCERAAPGGRVLGLDSDPTHVAMASELVSRRGLTGVEIVQADTRRTGLPSGSFDLVHARTLLINVPEPAEVLAEMIRLTRPGSWVASVEPDCEFTICYPPHPVFDRLRKLRIAAFSRNGADPLIGRRLAELHRKAGLQDVRVSARAGVYPLGHSRRTIRVDLVRAMRQQILAVGLADEQELQEADATARARLDDPDVVTIPSLIFLAWGRKPAATPVLADTTISANPNRDAHRAGRGTAASSCLTGVSPSHSRRIAGADP